MLLKQLIIFIDTVGPLMALPFFLYSCKKKTTGYLLILLFILLQLLANGYGKILMLQDKNNIEVYQVNAFFSCLLVSWYILMQLKKLCSPRFISVLTIYALFSCAALLVITIMEDTSFFNSLSYTFTGFTICVFCIIFYLQSLVNLKEENLIRSVRFWAVSAFFLYYSLSFFIFLYYKIFTQLAKANFQVLWGIHNVVLFLSCIILIIASKQKG